MAELNKINLKALKENYMKKPDEEKEVDDNSDTEQSTDTISINSNDKELNSKIKSGKATDKELFSKYESFFKKQEEKIQEKLHKEAKVLKSNKKPIISIILIILLVVPAYFIYSWWNINSIKASIFWTKEKNTASWITDTNTGTTKVDPISDEIPKTKEILTEKEKFNFWWYIFDIETQTTTSWEKTFHYKSKEYSSKKELRKWLEKEIEKLKRKKLIKLLLEEKKLQEESN